MDVAAPGSAASSRALRRVLLVVLALALAGAVALLVPGRGGARPTWHSSFERRGLAEWSWRDGGHTVRVVDAVAAGIPPLAGAHVARFETTRAARPGAPVQAKLYESFGRDLDGPRARPPADVSGSYRAWFFFPRGFRVPRGTWVNLFQFKEKYQAGAERVSDPLWWVQLGSEGWTRPRARTARAGRSEAPVAFLNFWGNRWRHRPRFVAVPLGRWVEIRADVRQGQRIDFSLGGTALGTARASQYPVSPFHGAASREWIFGMGEYSTGRNGPLFIDDAAVYPLP